MKNKWKIALILLIATATAAGFYTWGQFSRKHTDTAKLEATFTYDATALVKEFEEDEEVANAKFNDKVLAVKGIIVNIDFNDSAQSVTLGIGESQGSVLCQFDASQKDEVARLKMGEHAAIKGVCTGILMDVILVRCVIDRPL